MSVLGLAVKAAKAAAKKAAPKVPDLMPRAEREAALAAAMSATKIRDQRGFPKKVYHSTERSFDAFKAGPNDIGIHFGTPRQANERLKARAEVLKNTGKRDDVVAGLPDTPNVVPAYLNLTNPIRLDDPGNWHPNMLDDQLLAVYPADKDTILSLQTPDALRDYLRFKGHDGVIYHNTGERDTYGTADSYIAFDPQQIKSPFNRGTFDMTDPDFMKARGGHISTLAVKRKAKR